MKDNIKNQTNFVGPVSGNIHTGDGDINVSLGEKNKKTNPERPSLNKILVALVTLGLVASVIWTIKSHWDYEPIITMLGLLGGLITLLAKKNK